MLATPHDRCVSRRCCRRPTKFLRRSANFVWNASSGKNRSIYEPGERAGAWIKHRTNRQQEFVIGGYVPGAHGFDALLVGVYENKEFIFVAKVKDGFVPRIRDEILPALQQTFAMPASSIGRKGTVHLDKTAQRFGVYYVEC